MWGGRFEGEASTLLRQFNDSFSFDRELFAEDITGSIAWAQALASAGALTQEECDAIVNALKRVPPPGGAPAASPAQYEDIHSYVESKLHDAIGPLAGKLHTGRSRNDQVATDLRLWLRKASREAQTLLRSCGRVLAERAFEEAATPMPGYTHSKQAEPVTFGHWCLAYAEMLKRDESRFGDSIARGDVCPLGSGALSGTPLPIDRNALANALGFAQPTANSLDAVSDRDAAAEYLFNASLLLSHLSRLAEDLIFFSSDEARYVELADAFATGSSRMPHKKNPDVLELIRGHAARSIGELTGLLALLKGLPLAYDKDLQLDKEPLFRIHGVLAIALPTLTGLLAGLTLNRDRMHAAASTDLLLATELADALAARGVPFREAHEIVGRRLSEALRSDRTLRELGAEGKITDEDLRALDVERALEKRAAEGGTAPQRVREAAKRALAALR